jgi:hypothetical protein
MEATNSSRYRPTTIAQQSRGFVFRMPGCLRLSISFPSNRKGNGTPKGAGCETGLCVLRGHGSLRGTLRLRCSIHGTRCRRPHLRRQRRDPRFSPGWFCPTPKQISGLTDVSAVRNGSWAVRLSRHLAVWSQGHFGVQVGQEHRPVMKQRDGKPANYGAWNRQVEAHCECSRS